MIDKTDQIVIPADADSEASIRKEVAAALGVTDRALEELRAEYEGLAIADGDEESYKTVSKAIGQVSGLRTSVEEARKRIKAPYLERCKIIDAEAARVKGALEEIEQPLFLERKRVLDAKKAAKEAAERAEAERLAAIQARFDEIRAHRDPLTFKTSADVAEAIAAVKAIELTEEAFAERLDEARGRVFDALTDLEQRLELYVDTEAEEARRAEEAERLRKEREEFEEERRVAELREERRRALGELRRRESDAVGTDATQIRRILARTEAEDVSADRWGDLAQEAADARAELVRSLQALLRRQEAFEAREAELRAAEERKAEAERLRAAREQAEREAEERRRREAEEAERVRQAAEEAEKRRPAIDRARDLVDRGKRELIDPIALFLEDDPDPVVYRILGDFAAAVRHDARDAIEELDELERGDHESAA